MRLLTSRFGLGDLAYWAFRPLVYFVDAVWDTDMKHCEVCAGRRARWNASFSMPVWLVLTLVVTMCSAAISWRHVQ